VKAKLLQGFFLGDLFVEPLKGSVTGRGFSEYLSPDAVEVLLRFADSPGSLVTREALLEKVWGAGNGDEDMLSQAITEVRRALHDTAESPTFIQTLPGRGYRLILEPTFPGTDEPGTVLGTRNGPGLDDLGFFQNIRQRGVLEAALAYLVFGWLLIQVADVVFEQLLLPDWTGRFVTYLVIAGFPVVLLLSWYLEYRDGKAVLDTGTEMSRPRQRLTRTYLSVVGSLAVASIVVFAYDRYVGLPQPEASPPAVPVAEQGPVEVDPNSIAVLKFLNVDGSEQTEILASGFADELINRLALLPGTAVSSRGDAWSLGPNPASSDIRRRLRVAFYVEGSVRLVDDALSVNIKLVDSETGFQVTSRNLEAKIEDFNRVLRDITNVAVANLRIVLPESTQSTLNAMHEDADVDAFILYRRGKEIFEQPRTVESLTAAIDLYRQALAQDPGYAAAHAGLCSAYVELYEETGGAEDIRQAEVACRAALRSDSRLHMVYSALGELYANSGRIADAEQAFENALAINAKDAQAMAGLADIYRRTQRFTEAEELLTLAIERQPGNWRAINSYGGFLFAMGRYHDAAEQYRLVVSIDPNNATARSNLGSALTLAAEFEEARQVLEETLALQPIAETYSSLGIIHYYLGDFDKSVEKLRRAAELTPSGALIWINLADSLYFAGRADEATEAYQRARDLSTERLEVDSSDGVALTILAWAEHMLGDSDAALALVDESLHIDPGDPYTYYYDALIRYQTGDRETALTSLAAALEKGYPPGLLVAEPHLGEIRADDRFHAIIVDNIR
jgi:tetratricopeptide (TPR) repeat protein/DNA-binding winged helix-turn-helix (wHTH) protein